MCMYVNIYIYIYIYVCVLVLQDELMMDGGNDKKYVYWSLPVPFS